MHAHFFNMCIVDIDCELNSTLEICGLRDSNSNYLTDYIASCAL